MNIKTKKGLENFISEVFKNAKEHGWHEEKREVGTVIALMHSELSEALEFARNEQKLNKKGINALHHYAGVLPIGLLNFPKGIIATEEGVPIASNVSNKYANKPDGYLVELADVIIRIFDEVGSRGLEKEFVEILLEKHEYNKTRPYKHGNKGF